MCCLDLIFTTVDYWVSQLSLYISNEPENSESGRIHYVGIYITKANFILNTSKVGNKYNAIYKEFLLKQDDTKRKSRYYDIFAWVRWKRTCTWDSFVAPVITDDTLGFDAHQAMASWDKGTPSSSAMGFNPLTFLRVSSTSDLLARFYKKFSVRNSVNRPSWIKVLAKIQEIILW